LAARGAKATVTDAALLEALADSQRLGMLGDRPVADIVEHSVAFVAALAGVTGIVADLGSGGGVPGLVVARARPDLQVILIERRGRRADHLRRLVGRLDLADRVEVLSVEATAAGALLRRSVDAVVVRGFGPPSRTLRSAAPLLRSGGLLVVSEPPAGEWGESRWPPALLNELGLATVAQRDRRVAVFRQSQLPSP
jgi:16S rRNA (guanine527-N7)-methyltransferase